MKNFFEERRNEGTENAVNVMCGQVTVSTRSLSSSLSQLSLRDGHSLYCNVCLCYVKQLSMHEPKYLSRTRINMICGCHPCLPYTFCLNVKPFFLTVTVPSKDAEYVEDLTIESVVLSYSRYSSLTR